jgi:hypothetical protein
MSLRPTLLFYQPDEVPKLWNLFGTSNHQGVNVISRGGAHRLAGSKAFFLGMDPVWSDNALHFSLLPARAHLPILDAQLQDEIASRFQARLLKYRLHNFQKLSELHAAATPPNLPETSISRNLNACVQNQSDFLQAIAASLRRQHEEVEMQRGCDPSRALVEVIWSPLHARTETTISRITELLNALLRVRGETLEFTAEETGWKLRGLGFSRRRNGGGKVLKLSRGKPSSGSPAGAPPGS